MNGETRRDALSCVSTIMRLYGNASIVDVNSIVLFIYEY